MDKTIIELTPKFTKKTMNSLGKLELRYDADEDTLFIKSEESIPAVSYDLGGEIWIRFEPESKEIIGFEIENFESVFVKKYPEIANAWKAVRPFCDRKKARNQEDDVVYACFIKILLSFFDELLKNNPQQTSFGIA